MRLFRYCTIIVTMFSGINAILLGVLLTLLFIIIEILGKNWKAEKHVLKIAHNYCYDKLALNV